MMVHFDENVAGQEAGNNYSGIFASTEKKNKNVDVTTSDKF